MEAVRIFDVPKEIRMLQKDQIVDCIVGDLKSTLENLVRFLFGKIEMRWVPAYFPFTDPSLELEIFWNGQWLEMLGCGMVHPKLLDAWRPNHQEAGWAAGLGLERFAMLLFDIPDIRYFWTNDERFLSQFSAGQITKFKPYSKFPPCWKDMAFWIQTDSNFIENDFYELVRNIGGDLIERVDCVDVYEDQQRNRTSKCFRINYRALDRTLVNDEVNSILNKRSRNR